MSVTFTTTLTQAEGMQATGLPIPDSVVEALGGGRAPAVVVSIPGFSYRGRIATRNGSFIMGFSAANREATGLKAGDVVEATLELDTAPRSMEIPDDLAAALRSAGVLEAFTALSYSRQRAHIDPINEAKTDETRLRRVEKAVASLQQP
ncbi:MAG: hypothetical protein JWR53_1938 [Glaciihabitans sp.]|nr:hypothetical protein [Glaciihabitans sp.]